MIRYLHHLVTHTAKKRPNHIAVIETGKTSNTITYSELEEKVSCLAVELLEKGVHKGERIGILSKNSIPFIVTYFAICQAGGVAVPFNYALDEKDIVEQAKDCAITGIFVGDGLREKGSLIISKVKSIKFTIGDCDIKEICREGNGKLEVPRFNIKDMASIIYTSGTTRRPLGVMLSHGNLIANSKSIVKYLGLTSTDKVCCVLPFYYSYGLSLLFSHFLAGGTIVLENRFMYPNFVLDTIDRHKATGFAGIPLHYAILLRNTDLKSRNLPSLQYFTQAGDKMPSSLTKELIEAFPNKKLFLMYGQTEASPRLTYLKPGLAEKKPDSIGRAIPGVKIKLVKKNGKECRVGERGEIIAKGKNVMLGYWKNKKETKKVFKKGWLCTRDIAFKDESGDLFIVGRKRNRKKRIGVNMKKIFFIISFLFVSFFSTTSALAKIPVPERTNSWVNDYAGIIDESTKKYLEKFIASVEKKTSDSIEIIIATFKSLEGWELDDFVTKYGENWRMGRKTRRDNGVVLVVVMDNQRVSMGVGQNLRGILTDVVVNNLIQNVIVPKFREGNYPKGIKNFVETIAEILLKADIPSGLLSILLTKRNIFIGIAILLFFWLALNSILKFIKKRSIVKISKS